MFALNRKKKRFTLLFLEENEIYIQDLTGSCSFPDTLTGLRKSEKGKIHLCSRSIIFEANNSNIPIQKFLYKQMKKEPTRSEIHQITTENGAEQDAPKNDEITFEMKKVVEIVTEGPPAPYKMVDVDNYEVTISPAYENIDKVLEKINKIVEFSKTPSFKVDPQEELNKLVIEDSKLKFNNSHLVSINEKPLIKNQNQIVKRILPLVSIPGIFYVTNENLYFQSLHSVVAKPVKVIHLSNITRIFKRRYELRQIGLEIYTQVENKKKSYYFSFGSNNEREEVYNALIGTLGKEFDSERRLDQITDKWQQELITNYEYLMYLNEAADRTFSDLTQYPVFPWVISDYESDTLDLNNTDSYRDLTKPIGALNPERLELFLQRARTMPEPKYLYGTHYSAPGYVIGYLMRKHPQYMLKLQSGSFDKPDRMFRSIKKDWHNVMKNNAIVKELIPEFYGEDPTFLANSMMLDLGVRQNGKRVNEVKLPGWAKDFNDFLRINREALESKYVSMNLHHWIDLIFGYKQRGVEAEACHNVFHYLTYEGAVDLDSISDPMERNAISLQINEFGQTPKQLFKTPHVARYDIKSKLLVVPRRISAAVRPNGDGQEESKSDSVDPGSRKESYYEPNGLDNIEVVHDSLWEAKGLDKLKTQHVYKVHKGVVSEILELSENRVLSIGEDGFIKLTQTKDMCVSRSFKVCDLSLSSIVPLKENELYALGSLDNNLYIFNLNYGTKVFSESLHNDAISQIAFDKNKSMFYTGSWDCSVRAWGYKGGQIDISSEEILAEMNSQISKICLSADGNKLLFSDIEGNINLIDLRSRKITASYSIEEEKITALKFLNDNQIVAAGESIIKLFDISGKEYIRLPIDSNLGTIMDMEIDGANFIIATDRGNASVYDILKQQRIGAFFQEEGYDEGDVPPEFEFECMRILNDGKTGIFGSKSGALTFAYY